MNDKQYYITRPDRVQEGPYDEESLIARYKAGKYPEGTLVWCEGMESWILLTDVYRTADTPLFRHYPFSSVRRQKRVHALPRATWITSIILFGCIVGFGLTYIFRNNSERNVYSQEQKMKKQCPSSENNIPKSKKLIALLEKIKAGADVNVKEKEGGRTALIQAAEDGNTECVKLLLVAGADVNAKDEDGFTPLVCAAKEGYTEIVKALVTAGVDINMKKGGSVPP